MHFRDLNEAQILALAITAEEEDARIYRDFAESLRADFPATAELFTSMAAEEDGHRHRLIELYRQRFGEGASVDTEPSINPASPGWMNRNTSSRRAASRSWLTAPDVVWASVISSATASCRCSSSARSSRSCRMPASFVRCAAAS